MRAVWMSNSTKGMTGMLAAMRSAMNIHTACVEGDTSARTATPSSYAAT